MILPKHKTCNSKLYQGLIFLKEPGNHSTIKENIGRWCRTCKKIVEKEEIDYSETG